MQHIDKFSIFCIDKKIHTTYGKFVYMLYGGEVFIHTTCRQVAYMLYEKKLLSMQHTDKLFICCMDEQINTLNVFELTY